MEVNSASQTTQERRVLTSTLTFKPSPSAHVKPPEPHARNALNYFKPLPSHPALDSSRKDSGPNYPHAFPERSLNASRFDQFRSSQTNNLMQDKVGGPSSVLGVATLAGEDSDSIGTCDSSLSFRPRMSRHTINSDSEFRVRLVTRHHDATRRCSKMITVLERALYLHSSVQGRLTALVNDRVSIEQRLANEATTFARRKEYLKDCRAAAEREEKVMIQESEAVNLLLATAKEKQAAAAADRAVAHQKLSAACGDPTGTASIFFKQVPQTDSPTENNIENDVIVPSIKPPEVKLEPSCTDPPITIVTSVLTSTATALPTPPDSPESSPDAYFSQPDATVNGVHEPALKNTVVVVPQRTTSDTAIECQSSLAPISQPTLENFAHLPKDTTGSTCESPIGPYVRPPMPIEDMRRCIRCLLGKDKSLKTGNHARAFLGLPWSEIVSFDPDMLLARGVSGIKEGSTGMASRLRMMTIIESALSNQNNSAIGADLWENPTFFCESCQERYPITVNTDKPVVTFEQSEETKDRDVVTVPALAASKTSQANTNPSVQQHTGNIHATPRRKRCRKKVSRADFSRAVTSN